MAFYKDGDFTAAYVEFKRAYELAPNYRVLFNLGQTSRELKDYAAALSAFEQYLREGGKEVPAARRKDVQGWVDQLKKKVGTITVVTNVDGAEILVDDVAVGSAPLAAPVVVNVGRRKFGATMSGYTPARRSLEIAGTQETTVSLELEKIEEPREPAAASEPPTPPAVEVAEKKPSLAPWVALSGTAAVGIVTGVMGGLAVSARGRLDDALGTFPGNGKTIGDAQSRARTFAMVTDIAGAVTIVGAVATVVLFAVAPSASEKPRSSAEVLVSPTGLVVRGGF